MILVTRAGDLRSVFDLLYPWGPSKVPLSLFSALSSYMWFHVAEQGTSSSSLSLSAHNSAPVSSSNYMIGQMPLFTLSTWTDRVHPSSH